MLAGIGFGVAVALGVRLLELYFPRMFGSVGGRPLYAMP